MRRDYLFFLTALLISSATFGQNPSTPRPKAEKCAVAGMVVRKGSNEPIHFARVTLSREGEEQKLLHAATGADGRFVIKDVIPGEYQLTVSHNGYVSEAYGARRPMEPGLPLKLTPGKQVDDLIFRMTPAEAITARDDFERTQLARAQSAFKAGNTAAAYNSFGQAIHPMEDLTSPEHTDEHGNPKPWCGTMGCGGVAGLSASSWHSFSEWQGNETRTDLNAHPEAQRATNAMVRKAYEQMTGTTLNCDDAGPR